MNSDNKKKSVIAVGNFDGFHLGHQKIIGSLKEIAAKENLVSSIITFTPNPKQYFKKEKHLIFTDAQKKKILQEQQVDIIAFIKFKEISHLRAREFVQDILIGRFNMRHLVVGENFKFGRGRAGDIKSLKDMAVKFGFKLRVVKPEKIKGIRISSSHIRERVARGEFAEANLMLGRPYCIAGIITEGDKMGRELGFPTINVKTENSLLPEGVFETNVEIDEEVFASITNVGSRPTFLGVEKRIESHIFEFDKIVYGKAVKIFFERKLRDEIKFASKNNLIDQIKKDIKNLRI